MFTTMFSAVFKCDLDGMSLLTEHLNSLYIYVNTIIFVGLLNMVNGMVVRTTANHTEINYTCPP